MINVHDNSQTLPNKNPNTEEISTLLNKNSVFSFIQRTNSLILHYIRNLAKKN